MKNYILIFCMPVYDFDSQGMLLPESEQDNRHTETKISEGLYEYAKSDLDFYTIGDGKRNYPQDGWFKIVEDTRPEGLFVLIFEELIEGRESMGDDCLRTIIASGTRAEMLSWQEFLNDGEGRGTFPNGFFIVQPAKWK